MQQEIKDKLDKRIAKLKDAQSKRALWLEQSLTEFEKSKKKKIKNFREYTEAVKLQRTILGYDTVNRNETTVPVQSLRDLFDAVSSKESEKVGKAEKD